MKDKERLLHLLRTRAYKTGDFTLKSGRKSNYLIDCKNVALSPIGQVLIGKVVYEHIDQHVFEKKPGLRGCVAAAIAGVELGGCPLATAVSYYSASCWLPMQAVFVRKAQKEHGSKSLLEGAKNLPLSAVMFVVEDVTTTSGSAMFAVEQLWRHGFNVNGVITLVDRGEGAREALAEKGIDLYPVFTAKEIREYKVPYEE